nr:class I SAM-dependent RNA methyltransferase [Maliibacterium massiliense]
MQSFTWIATAAFGVEGIVARELRALGLEDVRCENGRVLFCGDARAGALANMHLRCADRVFLRMAAFPATSFEELFQGVRAIDWGALLGVNDKFPVVRAKSVQSKLFSLRDLQAITKRAMVEAMKRTYHRDWFDETGATYPVEVSLYRDVATIALDASGTGLHRRGYRPMVGEAPLRETLAAALVTISRYDPERPFHDPMCGTGTLPIEAAMIARRRAPGLTRSFACESWSIYGPNDWRLLRQQAEEAVDTQSAIAPILGTDIDERALYAARTHARLAGVEKDIHFQRMDVRELTSSRARGLIVCNPPYGERLGDKRQAEALYRVMGNVFRALPDWKMGVITPQAGFERCFGARARSNRKLYNGKIQCYYYQYY